MSLDDWRALGEDTAVRSELQEGVLIVSPSPRPSHQDAITALILQVGPHVPAEWKLAPDLDVIIDPAFPPTVRRPDLSIRRSGEGREVTVDQVLLVVEILSPGTRRQDLVTKRSEYADAGIPHYWIVDLDAGPTLETLTLRDGTYEGATYTGEFETTEPFALRVDPTALT